VQVHALAKQQGIEVREARQELARALREEDTRLLSQYPPQEAWVVDYRANGSRTIETFKRKKDADAREAQVTVDIGKGVHVAPSKSVTVAEAGDLWIKACEEDELERATVDSYKQHLRLHINPRLAPTSSRL
jgi:hypothetical protein